jgi:ubiquinol-cytochrome c reductase cytochrome b subunit
LLIALQAISGTLLALFYSPSTAAAWASVAYVEDQVALGWFVRGVHRFGTSAVLIVIGLHLLVTAIRAGYRAPREMPGGSA